MRTRTLTKLFFIAIVLSVSTALIAVYSRANEEFSYAMSEEDCSEHDDMHGVENGVNGQCEDMHEEHHGSTTNEESHQESYRYGCH